MTPPFRTLPKNLIPCKINVWQSESLHILATQWIAKTCSPSWRVG